MSFLDGATSLCFSLKTHKTSETINFFPFESFDHTNKMQNTEFPSNDAFYSKLLSCNHLVVNIRYYVNSVNDNRASFCQIETSKATTYRSWNYQYLQESLE